MNDWQALGLRLRDLAAAAGVSTGIIVLTLGCFVLAAVLLQIVTRLLRTRWFELLGERSWTFLAMPGTVVHETGHALFCVIFRHRIEEMKLFSPAPDGTLGYVNHSWDSKNIYQRVGIFFIGTGPVIFGTALLIFLTALLMPGIRQGLSLPDCHGPGDLAAGTLALTFRMLRGLFIPEAWLRWESYLWVVLMLLIGSHITLSRADLKGLGSGALLLLVILYVFDLAVLHWFDPAELLLYRWGSYLAGALAGVLLILAVLSGFTAVLYLPVFSCGKGTRQK